MDIELVPITRLTVEPHRFSRTSITSNIFDHRKDSYSIEIRRKPLKTNHSFKARYLLFWIIYIYHILYS